ncbi:MAG: hypothetical protein H7Z38_07995, partial [Rubrivivax sp.]|nr:hypothetical protein [Pyrinomonadaceae bacterium]
MIERGGNVGGGEASLHRGWLWWLIMGRVLIAGVLIGVGALWAGGLVSSAQESHRLSGSLPLALFVLALS